MDDQDRLKSMMNKNIKLAPLMTALTWDVIFVWTIEVMFLTQVKGVSYSNVVMLDTFLMLFGVLGCLLVGRFFKNMSPTIALRIGLVGYASYLLLLMFGNQYYMFILAQVGLGFGYAFCGVKINTFINDSLILAKRTKDFSRVSGSGMSLVYIIEGVGAILITYVYNWKPMAAFYISLGVVCLAFALTFVITDTKKYMKRNVSLDANANQTSKGRKGSMRFARARGVTVFLICVLIFSFFMRGALASVSTAYKIFLQQSQDAGVTAPWIFGYLFALSRVMAAIMSKTQSRSDLKYGIRTIGGYVSLILFGFFAVSGLILTIPTNYVGIAFISILLSTLYGIRPALMVLLNKYTNAYFKVDELDSVMSKKMLAEYFGSATGSFVFSRLLAYYNDALGMTFLMLSFIFVIPLVVSAILLLRSLFTMFKNKQTIIKKEYTEG